ncbi:RIP metalloprotease RseP [Acidihalobacter prosperus]|uniref:Zinc metalloprotease n=1 Tax=Acidihalobacter prosperus TaxID=160660 RepID=A0A1A6C902_9GAMM|nr:RIP metalloprotease RseP [Acidihalobacter prosperus]OBS11038.1 RIP metalloprotease RseP [Acidihalobacter prosperus]
MNILWDIAAFIVAVSILVTVHEFGHFWVARRLGVRVLRFSVGFGRPLLRWHGRDEVEYVIAALPFGGYVKMVDEREGEVPEALRERAFNRQPVTHRMAIVAAGPVANFLLAILLYAGMFMVGVQGIRPYVGAVSPGSPAALAGFHERDLILDVNGSPVQTWEQARLMLLADGISHGSLVLRVRTPGGHLETREIPTAGLGLLREGDKVLQLMGLSVWRPSMPVIAKVMPGGAAAKSGLKPGDRILSMDGKAITSTTAWIKEIQDHPGQRMPLTVERDGKRLALALTPRPKTSDGHVKGFIDAQIGGIVPEAARKLLSTEVRYGPLEALVQGAVRTWDMTVLTLRVMGKLVVGEASVRNLSGPVTIAEYAGITAAIGLSAFLGFLAIVSLSLGVLNLLPVPILDGGHLLYQTIELLRGKPLSEHAELIGQKIGLVFLGALMSLAFYNDISRLLT